MLFGFLFLAGFTNVNAQSFSQNGINFDSKGAISNGTSLMFGPDGRLYVAEYTGQIKIFTIQRNGPGDYVVLKAEVLNGILEIEDHNDDGTLYSSTERETIGLTVSGTSANPVIYVTSSDFRIGAGGGGDVGLDTNSGIITRLTWNGSAWDEVDIVRGLPRSEENHATNGLEFVTVNGTDYLIVAQGGHTNAGGPSKNFAYTTEYALSAAVLSVNLTQIESMPILDDNGRKYIYDLPTLDDPTRENVNGVTDPDAPGYDGIDVNDPFGGNDGLNQAMIVPGGPVQIFSPGYRNTYDLVVTESGAVYVTDNGANGGWGGFPVNEGGGSANNDYDPNEPGSSTATADGEKINNKDHLSLVTLDIQNYVFGSFYGGHPTPVRANPFGAGLYTNPAETGTEGAVFRTLIYHPTKNTNGFTTDPNLGLPANWPPVKTANPQEGDYRGPGDANPDGPVDELVTIWGTNTNGIDEYTASNFNDVMKGNLIAGVNTGELRRVELNADGSLKELTPSFASNLGGNALGVTCNSDSDPFPGTIWVVTLDGNLVVLEPDDFICPLPGEMDYDPTVDYDQDGYTNQDEIDNGTDHCNGGSQPADFDKAAGGNLVSDLNDTDDDNDGILDAEDPFQLGDPLKTGSDAFVVPVINELFSSNTELKGYLGLGLTGLMNNGDPNPNWLNWLDRRDDPNDPNPNDILGGAIGAMTMQMTSGTASGTFNTQEKGFQYGVQVDQTTGIFTVAGRLLNFSDPLQLYGNSSAPNGELGIFIGDGTQSNYVKFVLTPSGITAQQEITDNPLAALNLEIPAGDRPASNASLYFHINPSNGEIDLEYQFDNGPRISAGTITAQGAVLNAIQQAGTDLAVGFIGTSNAAGVEVEGTWDFLNVTVDSPVIVQDLPDLVKTVGAADENFDLNEYFYDDKGLDNLTYTIEANTNTSIGTTINSNILTLSYPSAPAITDITIRATDSDLNSVEQTFTVTVQDVLAVLYRINAGGPAITSIDEEMDWGADTSAENSLYLTSPGSNSIYAGSISGYTHEVDQTTTPVSIFGSERYDGVAGAPNLTYSFPVSQSGLYEVRLYMGNGYYGTSEPGQRIFDVTIEGLSYTNLNDIDLSATFGHEIGGVITNVVEVTDGSIDISLIHGVENPLINGIEILSSSGNVTPVDTPIEVAEISEQLNVVGENLDGSLVVSATGGDGNLSYSMSGAPLGVYIEPTNGQIGGTIDLNADADSPYIVTITVDDNDDKSSDAVSTSFTWTITTGEPIIVQDLPNLVKTIGAADQNINLNEYFDDDKGLENLIYTVESNTNTSIGAAVNSNILTLSFPSTPAISDITIRATDLDFKFIEQTFKVTVQDDLAVLYRVNAGGPAITSIDAEMDWGADTSAENSPYLSEPGSNTTFDGSISGYTNEVDQTNTPVSIFGTERFDGVAGAPNLTYSFPVSQSGLYEVRLYMGNGYYGTSEPGQRIFNVTIEGLSYTNLNDIDLSATFGHEIGGVITNVVEVTDGSIDISLIHGVENPLINGIEILDASGSEAPIEIAAIADQVNTVGDNLDGTLVVSATGGDGDLVYSITGAPKGVTINSATGVISGTIDMEADVSSPYSVLIKVDDSDAETTDAVTTGFTWTVTETPQTLIQVAAVADQSNNVGDNLDGTLVVSATGGDGDLVYSMTGAPLGVLINSSTGVINGTIDLGAHASSPYAVVVKVDDSDGTSEDAVTTGFTWTISKGEPVLVGTMPDLERYVDAPDESINLDSYFDDDQGVENLTYTAQSSNSSIGVSVTGNILQINYPSVPANSNIKITATDEQNNSVEQNFTVTVLEISLVLHRVNAGGPAIASIDGEKDWGADTSVENSIYLIEPGSNTVAGYTMTSYDSDVDLTTTPTDIFTSERSDNNSGAPNMTYSFPVPKSGTYQVRLYFGSGNNGNSRVGRQIFDVEIEGVIYPELDDLDLIVAFGHQVGGVISQTIEVVDGFINISFIHGAKKNPMINGIEIINASETTSPIQVSQIQDQNNIAGDELDGSLMASATGGDGDLAYSMTGAPSGVTINSTSGIISGTIDINADLSSPYSVVVKVDDSDTETTDAVTTSFTWTVSETPQNPIQVAAIANQANTVGDNLDGSLVVSATGGDGDLVYSMTGAPLGVTINSASGVISGTIDMNADLSSPYSVVVKVDDSDTENSDAKTTGFTWTITAEGCLEENKLTWYIDSDGDGFGFGDPVSSLQSCEQPVGYVGDNTDCDDSDYTTYPGAPEICDGKDNNCDGNIDENLQISIWYADKDGDGFGDPNDSVESCNQPNGYVADNTDCNDNDNTIYPGATEVPNDGIDQDCNGEDLVDVVLQGCTAEFWAGSSGWCSTYQPTDSFFTVFGITNKRGINGKANEVTLLEALSLNKGGYDKLAKQATAALLNACSSAVNYEYPEAQIKTDVQEVFNNSANNNSHANKLSSTYETANNAGCPTGDISTLALKSSEDNTKQAITISDEEPYQEEVISIKLYPNPASAEVYLQVSDPTVLIQTVAMYDYNGRYIRTYSIGRDLNSEGREKYSFNISGMPNGVYILKVSTESPEVFTLRLIKED